MNLAFAIWFVSSMLNRPQTCKPQPYFSHNELPNQRKTSVPCQADLNKKDLKYKQLQNNITEK